jgi:hypothetical protein
MLRPVKGGLQPGFVFDYEAMQMADSASTARSSISWLTDII